MYKWRLNWKVKRQIYIYIYNTIKLGECMKCGWKLPSPSFSFKPPSKALSSILGKSNLQFAGMSINLNISISSLNLMTPDSKQVCTTCSHLSSLTTFKIQVAKDHIKQFTVYLPDTLIFLSYIYILTQEVAWRCKNQWFSFLSAPSDYSQSPYAVDILRLRWRSGKELRLLIRSFLSSQRVTSDYNTHL